MDAKQFDELIARLTEGPSRRDTLKGAIGGALASLGIGAAADVDAKGKSKGKGGDHNGGGGNDAHGQKKKHHKHKNRRAKKCKGGKKHCGRKHKCFDLQTDPNHCGTCSTVCDVDETCVSGVCVAGPTTTTTAGPTTTTAAPTTTTTAPPTTTTT